MCSGCGCPRPGGRAYIWASPPPWAPHGDSGNVSTAPMARGLRQRLAAGAGWHDTPPPACDMHACFSLSLFKRLGSELPRYPSHLRGLLLLWGFGKLARQGSGRQRRGGAGERRAGAEGNGGECDPFRATGNVQHTANKQAAAELSWLPGSGKWRGRGCGGCRRVSTEVARLWSCTAGHGGRTERRMRLSKRSLCLGYITAGMHAASGR